VERRVRAFACSSPLWERLSSRCAAALRGRGQAAGGPTPTLSGAQALYRLTLRLELDGHGASDSAAARFGVRDIRSEVDPVLKGHVFSVNSQRARPRARDRLGAC